MEFFREGAPWGVLRCGGTAVGARRGLRPCLAVGLWEVLVLLRPPQVVAPGHPFCGGRAGEAGPPVSQGPHF